MSDPVFIDNNPLFFFRCDRAPTSDEPVVDSFSFPVNWLIFWWDTAANNFYISKDLTSTSQIWDKLIDSTNIFSFLPPARSFNNAASHSIVSIAAAANGFQISSTRDAIVNYSVTITTAVQIGVVSNVDGYVVLEISPTNSSTAGDWVEINRTPQAQNIGLALALSSTTKGGGQIGGVVPAGYYVRLRSVNIAGTPTYAYNSGQEVLL